ncbi:DUF4367 domain-containing protein [Dethiobacter alkaliphilus]|uniref:DUF4367 domain-containing protein n=1 Tax=Dethiobacter alkaliphilus TaxID=427926 RepID=UPI0022276A14|nr:DUF4367 domain-containing protein [Dethiobacter alkaliphilus]MCW3490368.1 DUF4367 domain-containing protein [Dethiobacter alkaliphilus]
MNKEESFDKEIKDAYNSIFNDIPDPDVNQAFEMLKQKNALRNKRRNENKFLLTAASILIAVIFIAFTGPAQAVRQLIFTSYILHNEDFSLVQQSESVEDHEIIVQIPDEDFYRDISAIQFINNPRLFVPGPELEDIFVSAEVTSFEGEVLTLYITFYYDDEIIRLNQHYYRGEWSSSFGFDTSTTTVEEKEINGIDVMIFTFRDSSTTMMWNHSNVNYQLDSNLEYEKLEEFAHYLQLF